MENTTEGTEQQQQDEEYVTVPKGTTVNVNKYERAVAAKDAAEKRAADLERQIAELTAKDAASQTALDEFKAKVEADAKAYADEKAKLEADLAIKEKTAELLRAECIDPESAIASLKDGETIEQLKERKAHLFKAPTKQSSMQPKDKPTETGDPTEDKMRKALGL